jgi:hypothetical protein
MTRRHSRLQIYWATCEELPARTSSCLTFEKNMTLKGYKLYIADLTNECEVYDGGMEPVQLNNIRLRESFGELVLSAVFDNGNERLG